ncbi:MAG: phosphoesterase PA-phosphatase related [Myxococcaceae bacterium]|nr:phosphoesterase PA-phosphatase related [Myxococcaceae bacterium]
MATLRTRALALVLAVLAYLALAALPKAHAQELAPGQPRASAATAASPASEASEASVYRVRLAVDLPVSAFAGLSIIIPYALSKRLIDERCPCDGREVNRFDRHAIGNTSRAAALISDMTVGAGMVLPVLLDAFALGFGRPLYEDALVFAETLALNGALVTMAKYIVQRPLPRTYAGDPNKLHEPGGYRSFYSGHTSLIFAALTASSMTMRLRYGEHYWPWLVTLLVGTSVAVERVADGRHFPTDVILGGAMGSLVGIGVPWLHARPSSFAHGLFAAPVRGGATLGFRGTL